MIETIQVGAVVSDGQLDSLVASAFNEYRRLRDGLTSLQASLVAVRKEIGGLHAIYDAECVRAIDDETAATKAARLNQEIAKAEPRVRGLELEIAKTQSDLTAAQQKLNDLAREQGQRREEAEKQERWESLRVQCRTAKESYDRCVLDFQVAKKNHDEAEHKVRVAANALVRAERSRLSFDNFPTDEELEQEEVNIRELERALAKAIEDRNLLPNVEVRRMAALNARDEFARLAWQERNLRPADRK